MRIREAGRRDLPAVADMWLALNIEIGRNVDERDAELYFESMVMRKADARRFPYIVLVADDDGKLAGFLEGRLIEYDYYLGNGSVGLCDNVYVRPDSRNRGVFKALMGEAERRAKTLGATRIEAHVVPDRRAVYERAGFLTESIYMRKVI